MVRRVVYESPGTPADVLRVQSGGEPASPGSGQLLVRVTTFPIHPGDLMAIESADANALRVAGVEATGIVEAVGAGVVKPGVDVGSRVTVFLHPGAWSEYLTVPSEFAVPVPDGVGTDVAAMMLVNPLTVVMLRRAVEATGAAGYNGVFLQSAAGSSVGRLMTAAAEHHGMALVNLVRTDEGADRLKHSFPATPVVATSRPNWPHDVRTLVAGRPSPLRSTRSADGWPATCSACCRRAAHSSPTEPSPSSRSRCMPQRCWATH
ncbi:alcohol dehydrogenase catalytic domain-containing protein [Dactylosporangium darangshiense]|uniref:alcohol dehydrogenase catalytic domain-containing protein n=1 Tax=Dactylosporangium darangshiense TaxID=579108 RepID=UPI003627BF97